MQITNSNTNDLEIIFKLFDSAIEYQKKKGYELWPVFSKELIEMEIKEKRHFKIIENNIIICIFSVMYNDPVIWGEKDNNDAIYLHRITINPFHKGKKIMRVIKEWATGYAKQKNKKFIRMDTWGNNKTLRDYYISCGFNYIGQRHLTKTEGVPDHYGGNVLSLFENGV